MKRLILITLPLILISSFVSADPLSLMKAGNYLEYGMAEVGLNDISYQQDLVEFEESGVKLTYRLMKVPIFARYAFSEKVEGEIRIPYQTEYIEIDWNNDAVDNDDDSDASLGNTDINIKYSIPMDEVSYSEFFVDSYLAFALGLGFHTGGENYPRGLDINPRLLYRKEIDMLYAINFDIGYTMTGAFDDDVDDPELLDGAIEGVNPGDILRAGIGAEYMVNDEWAVLGEFTFDSFTDVVIDNDDFDNEEVEDSAGTRTACILGARYNRDNIRSKLGLDFSIGDETYRNYDWRVIAGISVLLGY